MRLTAALLGLTLWISALPGFAAAKSAETVKVEPTTIKTNAVIVPGPYDGTIASLTARLLERSHYSLKPFDPDVSSQFLDKYYEALDPQRLHLFEQDVASFDVYRRQLNDLTISRGDTTPATRIFMRFRDRLRQRVAYVHSILPKESFEFTSDERVTINRKDEPWPKNLADAQRLWRERLRYEMLQEKLNKEKPDEIVKILTRRYNRTLRAIEELDSDDVLQLYLTALAHTYDPHSDYFGKAALENFSIGMRLSLTGIGAVLSSEDGYCKIRELSAGGPAQRSKKLKPGDRIVAVAQSDAEPVDVIDMKLNKVVEMIRGPKNTEVRLTVIPADAPDSSVRRQIVLIRDEIKLEDQQAKARLIEVPDENGRTIRLGVIDLPSFYADFDTGKIKTERKSTTADVSMLVRKLTNENVSGIILDLRRNGGGSLEEAINLTGLFIKQGTVVQVRDPDGQVQRDDDTDSGVLYDGPLMVLTSRFSASASEILAGALQDYGRAVVVGDISTHGKGTVQSLVQLSPYLRVQDASQSLNPGALKVTIRKFYRASGASTQLKGVTPDIILPSVNNLAEVGEGSLDNPLPWDTVKSADYTKLNRVTPFLPELKKRSEVRLKSDFDFNYVREDIQQFKKVQAEKTVSLNEARRRVEKQEAEARTEARKKDLAARPEVNEKVYELTLKLASQPGLPPPMAKTNLAKLTGTPDGRTDKSLITGRPAATNSAAVAGVAGRTTLVNDNGITIVASSTNAVVSKFDLRERKDDDDDDEEPTEHPASRDIYLDEARRILIDFIKVSGGAGQFTTVKASADSPTRR